MMHIEVSMHVYIIDQGRDQDSWILAEFSFCVFMDRDEVEVHKNVKGELVQYPTIFTSRLVNKRFIVWDKEH